MYGQPAVESTGCYGGNYPSAFAWVPPLRSRREFRGLRRPGGMSHRGMIGSFGGRQKSGRLETSSVHGRANVARRKGWSRAGWGGHVTPRGRQCGTTSTREARYMAVDFRVLRHGSKGSSPKSAAPGMHADRPNWISDARAMSLSLSQLTSCVNSVLCTM